MGRGMGVYEGVGSYRGGTLGRRVYVSLEKCVLYVRINKTFYIFGAWKYRM